MSLAWCSQVSTKSLVPLAAGLPNLKTLNVACCDKLDDTAIEAIAAGCPRMRAIKTDQCDKITDRSIIALAQQCKQLEAVSFAGCPKLTAQSIEALVANCPRLCYLNMAHCELIPDAALQKLHEALPNCCVKKFFDSPQMDAGAQTQAPTMLRNPGCPHPHVVIWLHWHTRLSISSRIQKSCACLWVLLRMRRMCEIAYTRICCCTVAASRVFGAVTGQTRCLKLCW